MNTGLPLLRGLLLAALVLIAGPALARPLLIPPQNLALPWYGNPSDPQMYLAPQYFSVAIDQGTLLVQARRALNAQNERIDGVYIFERDAAGTWSYAGILTEQWPGAVAIDDNVATTSAAGGVRIFERGASGWALTGTIPVEIGWVFRIDEGSIYLRREAGYIPSCVPAYEEWRKVSGAWTQVATIGGERCDQNQADVEGGRAIVVYQPNGSSIPQPPTQIFQASAPAWAPVASIPPPAPGPVYVNWFGPYGTVRGDTAHIDGGHLYRASGGAWLPAGRLIEPEVELRPNSYGGKLRGSHLFVYGNEVDYELPSTDWGTSLEWRTVRVYRQTPSGFVYHARLNPDFDVWGWAVSDDGRQVAASGADHNNSTHSDSLRLYVFEVPDTTSFPGTRQDNFSSGSFAAWTTTAGQFGVVPSGATRVLRQSSLTGEAGAHLTALDWTDQSIEADLRPLEFAGAGKWFGLVTRRTDAQNYYYVTFRSPNIVSLRRMRAGVYTELGWSYAPADFQPGRNYRMRLESVGDQHVVFMDDIPLVFVKDKTLTHGHPGVAGYRTRFDVDNVIVSGGTRVLMRLDPVMRGWSESWRSATGTWDYAIENEARFLRQSDNQADARWVSRVPAGYQVVRARLRPQSYGSSSDPWIGIAAQVVDDSNYYYLTLRRSQQLSLRRLVNGQIQVLATVPQPLTLGAWHDLRLEIIGTQIRAYVNGDLKIETSDPTLGGKSGRNAVLMYKTAADLSSYAAYQP